MREIPAVLYFLPFLPNSSRANWPWPQEPNRRIDSGFRAKVPGHLACFATSGSSQALANHKAKTAANSVPRKFTLLLLSLPGRSRAAPRRLSKNIPQTAARATSQRSEAATKPAQPAIRLIPRAARVPLAVPAQETPPLVPGATRAPFDRSLAEVPKACPHSLETVSAAASANDAAQAASREGLPRCP